MTASFWPVREPAAVEFCFSDPTLHDGLCLALAGLHQRNGLRFLRKRRIRGPVFAVLEARRRVKTAVALHPMHGLLRFFDANGAGISPQRRGKKAVMGEYRLALAEMLRRPGRAPGRYVLAIGDVIAVRTEIAVIPRAEFKSCGLPRADVLDQVLGREAQSCCLARPVLSKRVLVHIALVRARHQRSPAGQVRIVARPAEIVRRHRGLDLRAPRREGVDHPARHTGDLEASVRVGFLNPVSEVSKTLRQFRPVDGADGHLPAVEPVIDHGPPLAVLASDHIRDHAMGMELRIQVARGVVVEGGRHHVLPNGPDHRAGGPILYPGLDGGGLDPGEGASHGMVVRYRNPMVTTDQGGERDRLWRGQSDLAARPVVDVPVLVPSAELGPAWHLAFEYGGEGIGIDRTREAQGSGALARPGARLPVRRIVPGVVAVALEIGDALGGRCNLADRGYHRCRPARPSQQLNEHHHPHDDKPGNQDQEQGPVVLEQDHGSVLRTGARSAARPACVRSRGAARCSSAPPPPARARG